MNKVWLVTGSASGLGRNIAEAVLEVRSGVSTSSLIAPGSAILRRSSS